LGEGDIGAMSQHVSLNPGEYSYFSPRVLSMWAGPEHWKFRPRQPPAPGPEKDSRQRIPRKAFELDFSANIDFQAHFQETKAPTTLSKSVLESQSSRSTTLPADFDYNPENLRRLFLKPHVKLSPSSDPVGALDNEVGIEDYDYNNPNDTSNFCPALQTKLWDRQQGHTRCYSRGKSGILSVVAVIPMMVPMMIPDNPRFPPQVHKIPIQYARTAKRMDMRRLKRNMWELLTEQGEVRKGNSCWEFCRGSFP
ncbi:CND2 protein, partial [Emberiza fucata]|nr:CND2 protein [Emberiza fucata]